ncbi:MAG TPA: hypothetical protein VGH89_10090 [Pseudonocardia sp.]|jgi:hypothetical protein
MCSNTEEDSLSVSWRPPPAPAIAGHGTPSELPPVRAVWVLLDQIVRHDPATHRSVPDGLDFTGRALGVLYTETWRRSAHGVWLAFVNYQVHYSDGRPRPMLLREQLVPAYALAPRADNRPLG